MWEVRTLLIHYSQHSRFLCPCLVYLHLSLGLTELPGSLDVDVVIAAADANDNAQCLELLQVLSSQGDGVVHHGSYCLIQHLRDIWEEEASSAAFKMEQNRQFSSVLYYNHNVIIVLNHHQPNIQMDIP